MSVPTAIAITTVPVSTSANRASEAATAMSLGLIGGYSILQADDLGAVKALLDDHPHNQMGTIEILQLLPMPGA